MRTRQAIVALLATSALALTGCGSDDESGSGSDSTASGGPVITEDMGVEVSGEMGEKPTLTIPDEAPPEELQVQVLSEGDGPEVSGSDVVVADYLGQTWKPRAPQTAPPPGSGGSTPPPSDEGAAGGAGSSSQPSAGGTEPPADAEPYVFDNSYDRGQAAGFSLDAVIPGWKEGLAGQKVGSRVLMSIPPDKGYGAQKGHDLQNDTLVFVVDIIDSIDGTSSASGEPVEDLPQGLPTVEDGEEGAAPTIKMDGAKPPQKSDSTLVIKGDGDKLGNNIVINMVQAEYPDAANTISSWDENQTPVVLAPQQLQGIPGLAQALEGQTVGSRVVTRISAKDNAAQDGSKGTPLVLVIDVIGTF
ncbi:peptidylprolyl isomerase [Haloactinopolyspora alba]|uniref:peptidylprolyl isomerase n=1 Tax=Haloactinopolyspora alba TaxID=648780 RepID=A0A2P8D9J6_9ACTN|nr:FKBP-type peptidyl-prolyl cis-trans isomerase [Haloactinopolyspora alba]PSK93851.1 peptidylprolyl isomerase [Haloactinopolyspora alba]